MSESSFVIFIILIGLMFVGLMFAAKNNKKQCDEKVILKTVLLDKHGNTVSTTRTSTSSALGRGLVGGAVAGPLGAVAGAATAKQRTVSSSDDEYIFRVYWGDQTVTVEKCRYGDYWYKRYIEKLAE